EELARWLRERIESRNRLFGYSELKPVVDDFGPELAGKPSSSPKHPSENDSSAGESVRATPEPSFDKPPPSFYPPREQEIFVSYAWGDATPEGRQRAQVVDDLCRVLAGAGIKVRRDCDEMRPGALISEFMDRLVEGDFVLAVISDK